jgi:hypothetical protein
MAALLSDVRCRGQSGKHLLAASISPFDPTATWASPQAWVTSSVAMPFSRGMLRFEQMNRFFGRILLAKTLLRRTLRKWLLLRGVI